MYLYNDPPIWEAYIECAKKFDIDSVMDGYFPLSFPEKQDQDAASRCETAIVFRDKERIVTQHYFKENGKIRWNPLVDVYYVADPPSHGVSPEKAGLPSIPKKWEPLEGVKPVDLGPSGLKKIKELMGDQGLVGVFVTSTAALHNEEEIFNYYDKPEEHEEWAANRLSQAEARFDKIMALDVKPDFLCVGGSGTLVFQTPEIFRQLAFPAVRRIIERAAAAGIPTHVHSCGPEKELVRILAEETKLTMIDPLEIPPMGDCELAELKRLYGHKIVLKGNLHTTNVMLRGRPADVAAAARKAIDEAASGGRFILSTGDQCGRDTPFENLEALVETARTYGRY
ncbi:MAG: hypothetical protein A2X49_02335 [Lentisphaerae bacterium GWF2_52_8]|nr:MAG: hypothetical protein A2X49_02335 [Lentisphaerae bacterium GWF2_52_8]